MSYYNTDWGGKREGAGRPKKEPTKVFRLTDDEIKLIKLIRDNDTLGLFLDKAKTAKTKLDFL